MEVSANSSLEEKTKAYWYWSSVKRGKQPSTITVAQVISGLNNLIGVVNPIRPLFSQACDLQNEVVEGRSRKTKKKAK